MPDLDLDAIDWNILDHLQRDARAHEPGVFERAHARQAWRRRQIHQACEVECEAGLLVPHLPKVKRLP